VSNAGIRELSHPLERLGFAHTAGDDAARSDSTSEVPLLRKVDACERSNSFGSPEGKARVLRREEPAAESVGAALGFEVERDDGERDRFDCVCRLFDV
jgi:hypothetical protein